MVDMTSEMAQLWGALGAAPGSPRIIQFVAARAGEGTSTVAREFAKFASGRARRGVWLIDLDLMRSSQHLAIAAEPDRYGPLGQQAAASPNGSTFFTLQPPARGPDGKPWPDARYLVAHPVGGPQLWVSRFRREAMQPGQHVHILPTADYWAALRRYADLVVVDAPSIDRSSAALTVAPFMDYSVLVVAADEGSTAAPAALKASILASGGRVAGLFFNRGRVETPEFLKAVLP